MILVITMHGRLRRHAWWGTHRRARYRIARWPGLAYARRRLADGRPVFNQGRNHTANPGEKRFRARSEQAGIAVK